MQTSGAKKEVYSLGVNRRLPEETVEKVTRLLEDETVKTESISDEAVLAQKLKSEPVFDPLIDSFIERSRRTIHERAKGRQ